MLDHQSGNVIIFNGEIYNYKELKNELRGQYSFKTESDTEVILAAYAKYGVGCLNYLRGMFAIALYDARKNEVLLARDRLGIKPMYYTQSKGSFYFASEIKAFLKGPGTGLSLNHIKAYEFLANRQMDTDDNTFFSEIRQLPPGHFGWVNANGQFLQSKKYWDFPEMGSRQFDDTCVDEFVSVFDEVIKLHLRADVPVGCFVSGGIDSSSVACFALRNMKQQVLNTFSAILPYHHPENVLIGEINEQQKVKKHEFLLDGSNFFADLPNVIWHHDEPILDGSMYAHYKLCEISGREKIKVLLSGSGGDELFGGYMTHLSANLGKQLRAGHWLGFLKNFRDIKENSAYTSRSILLKGFMEAMPLGIRRNLRNKQLAFNNDHLLEKPEIPHFYFEHSDPYFANLINNYKSWSVPPYLHYEDRNSMAFGVEIRVPFYDHKLIEYILQFDSSSIVKGRSKNILRASFKGIVPEPILQQKGKFGFPSPIDHALVNDKVGKEMFYDLVKQTPLLNVEKAIRVADQFYSGKGDLGKYWRCLSFCIWYNMFLKSGVANYSKPQ
jgi:asparagine synthase (glutamine-hydrolysing)